MDNQSQRFCTNCGQPLAPSVAFCGTCGIQVNAPPVGMPDQFPAGAQPGYAPQYMQAPAQAQDDALLAGLAAGSATGQSRRNRLRQGRKPRSGLRGCGCLLLVLAVLVGPFIGFVLTTGRLHTILAYVAGGLAALFCLLFLLAMLLTRGGREALSEGCAEGCLDAIFGGLFGG